MLNSKDLGNRMSLKRWIGIYSLILTLMGCGSGREDFASQDPSTQAVSRNTFNIQAAWQSQLETGFSKSLYISGSCLGNLQISQGPAVPYKDDLYSLTNTLSMYTVYTYCGPHVIPPTPTNTLQANHYTAAYENTYFIWTETSGTWPPVAIDNTQFPTAVKVGDAGTIDTIALHDATGQAIGHEVWTYTLEANTATTALFHLTKTTHDGSIPAQWVKTQDERYIVNAQNKLELMSIGWKQADGFNVEAK